MIATAPNVCKRRSLVWNFQRGFFFVFFAALILGAACPARALQLQMMEVEIEKKMEVEKGKEKVFFYFPQADSDLADRLAADYGAMAAFLESRGLRPANPLHIILDEDLDAPQVQVSMYPHREIRIPLRPPGVLEDGFLEPDPWHYFLFKGLCMQGIYSERSGIPGGLHYIFGEIISPNLIMPEWTIDGISHLLYEQFEQRPSGSPLDRHILLSGPIPQLDKVSNHPEIWPGRFSYRIYGRPFMHWLHANYGWEKIHAFLRVHGGGIIPIEIDRKVKKVFGAYPIALWRRFQKEAAPAPKYARGQPLTGYWPVPFIYWNDTGVFPGLVKGAQRGRYGYVDDRGWLWLSRYEKGVARLTSQRRDTLHTAARKHVWDPGAGAVAVTRQGRRPYLLLNPALEAAGLFKAKALHSSPEKQIAGPPGVMQLSGPVADVRGRVAVAGNTGGNWDIWLYDGAWQRITTADSVELDPWFIGEQVVFSSNATGRFQIHAADMQPLTQAPTTAMLPRAGTYLQLGAKGWIPRTLTVDHLPVIAADPVATALPQAEPDRPTKAVSNYSPLKSIVPNYLVPDLFIDADNFQFGIATKAEDVSRFYSWDGGVRYSTDDEVLSWRLGGRANGFIARATHYRFGYTTARDLEVDETRYEMKVAWSPQGLESLETGANWRRYTPEQEEDLAEQEWWGSLNYSHAFGNLNAEVTLDWLSDGSQSLYGDLLYWFGQEINTVIRLQAGKTWGDLQPGHNSFRIGGSTGEGFFTQRTSRLFSIRGFDANILDDAQAATAGVEVFWPLARLQVGYRTLPLFLHNISVGTFVDSGFASEHPDSDDLLVSAGFELIAGMELAWGFMADFRLGWAWPLRQPDDLDQDGPVFLIQIGRPL